jgi:hypothetical protein
MRPIIWYRLSIAEEEEIEIAKKYFKCVDSRVKIEKDDYVVCRYSALPYFPEQKYDLEDCIGAKLINSERQHYYVAHLGNWVSDLEEYTPKTWYNLQEIPDDELGPFILKGETNSRKAQFNTMMFAKDRQDASNVYWRLLNDPLLQDTKQNICIRKYESLIKLIDGVNGLAVSKEFRIFVAFGRPLCGGFYWSNYVDDLPEEPSVSEVPLDWLYNIIKKIGNKINFYTIDVAQKQDGNWCVIELNDGTMSGTSCCNLDTLYKNLRKSVDKHLSV